MTPEEFEEQFSCLGMTIDKLPLDAILYDDKGNIIEIIEQLIPKDF